MHLETLTPYLVRIQAAIAGFGSYLAADLEDMLERGEYEAAMVTWAAAQDEVNCINTQERNA